MGRVGIGWKEEMGKGLRLLGKGSSGERIVRWMRWCAHVCVRCSYGGLFLRGKRSSTLLRGMRTFIADSSDMDMGQSSFPASQHKLVRVFGRTGLPLRDGP